MKKINLNYLLFCAITICSCTTKTAEEWYKVGQFKESKGYLKSAFKAYSKAIKKNNKNADYYLARAKLRLLNNIKLSDSGVNSDFNSALQINHWYAPILYYRAYYYYKYKNDFSHASRDLDSLLSRHPMYIEGYLLQGEMFYDRNDTASGNKNFRKAIEYSSAKSETIINIASIKTEHGYYKDALIMWQQALKLAENKDSFCCYSSVSFCFWKTNEKDSACYYWQLIKDKEHLTTSTFNNIKQHCEK